MMGYYGYGHMLGGWGESGFALVCWITLFLFWTLMVLVILTLIRHLTKEDKHGCCEGHKGSHHDGGST